MAVSRILPAVRLQRVHTPSRFLSDKVQPCPCILHGHCYVKDRDTRPMVWYHSQLATAASSSTSEYSLLAHAHTQVQQCMSTRASIEHSAKHGEWAVVVISVVGR